MGGCWSSKSNAPAAPNDTTDGGGNGSTDSKQHDNNTTTTTTSSGGGAAASPSSSVARVKPEHEQQKHEVIQEERVGSEQSTTPVAAHGTNGQTHKTSSSTDTKDQAGAQKRAHVILHSFTCALNRGGELFTGVRSVTQETPSAKLNADHRT